MELAGQSYFACAFRLGLALSLVVSINGFIMRNECEEYGNFSVVRKGYVLPGSVLETLPQRKYVQCKYACIDHRRCKSFNMEDKDIGTCELNAKSSEDNEDPDCLVPKAGWDYHSTDYNETNIGRACQLLKPCKAGELCTGTCRCPGYTCRKNCTGEHEEGIHCAKKVWPSCNEAFKTSPNKSGIFSVQIPGVIICKSSVYCDMAMDNKAWIVIQRHLSNETSFDRVWEDYKFGFGDLKGNFWLGLEKMHKLTNTRQTTLRFDLKHSDGSQGYAEYDNFKVADESQNYKLGLGAYDGNIGDSMRLNDGYPFTTKDRDNDQNSETNCAVEYSSGWWHFRCFEANVNNPYPEDKLDPSYYMSWWKWKESFAGITFSEMKIRYAD